MKAVSGLVLACRVAAGCGDEPSDGRIEVPMFARDLPPGHVVSSGDLVVARVPPGYVPDDTVRSRDALIGRPLPHGGGMRQSISEDRLAPLEPHDPATTLTVDDAVLAAVAHRHARVLVLDLGRTEPCTVAMLEVTAVDGPSLLLLGPPKEVAAARAIAPEQRVLALQPASGDGAYPVNGCKEGR